MANRIRLRSACFVIASLLLLSRVPAAQPQPAPPSLAGTWVGLYQVYPRIIRLTVTIADGGAQSGTFQAELRADSVRRNEGAIGTARGVVTHDPGLPSIDITSSGRDLAGLAFHAVYDATRGIFAGYRVGASLDASPYFLLVRGEQAERLFERIIELGDSGRGRRPSFGGSAPSEENLRKWASQIYAEYPDISPRRVPLEGLYHMARNMFRDEFFKPHFGKSFDELSDRDLTRIAARIDDATRGRTDTSRQDAALSALDSGFSVGGGTFTAGDMALSVVAMRSIAAWRRDAMARASGISPSTGGFAALTALDAEHDGVLTAFWPSERTAFRAAVDAQRAVLAGPALAAAVGAQLSSSTFADLVALRGTQATLSRATPASPTGPARSTRPFLTPARRLAAAPDMAQLASMVDAPARQRLTADVAARISSIVETEARRDSNRPAPGATGLAALDATQAIERRFREKYAQVLDEPSVVALFASVTEWRGKALQAAARDLEGAIAAAQTDEALRSVTSAYLNHPSDREDPVGRRLIAAIETKRAEIRAVADKAETARREAARARQQVLDRRQADVAARRKQLTDSLGVYLPTFADLFEMLRLGPTIQGSVSAATTRQFVGQARELGFTLNNSVAGIPNEVYADVNRFTNSRGHEMLVLRLDGEARPGYGATIAFPNAPAALIELYDAELRAGYRRMIASTPETSGTARAMERSALYVKTGGALYAYEVEKGTLTIRALDNFDASAPIIAERLSADTLHVNSYSRTTDVIVRAGDRIHFTATGRLTLGPFVGSTGPDGVDGFPQYARHTSFRLGALYGRIGAGDWFLVGAERTITAKVTGTLSLLINDTDLGNNDGGFDVRYVIERGGQ